MAVVNGKVPGGRQMAMLTEELSVDDDDDANYFRTGLSAEAEHRNGSQSLPRFSHNQVTQNEQPKTHTLPDDLDKSYTSLTLDRKKKSRSPSFKFGNFMQKMVRQMSIHSPRTRKKMLKNRSHSMTREPERDGSNNLKELSVGTVLNSSSGKVTLQWEKGKIPGVQGIRNHGNTCFMNAVIQCLGHTDLLVEYFITDHYKHDIKRNNKQNARKYGTKGDLTENLGVLLKSVWTLQYSSNISSDFKSVVGKYGAQYKGYAQHDAQEFLMWLLDKVHEDLNVATKKKFKPNKSHSRHDDISADILASHMRSNNSYMYDLFQAVFRSTLTCPNCRRQSNTYDPFLSISLPIPQKTKRPIYVTVVYMDAHPKQVRIGLLMDQCQSVWDLRQTLASDTKIPESQILLTEIYTEGFHRTFHDSQPLSDILETDNIYAVETPELIADTEGIDRSSEYLIIVVLNTKGAGDDAKRFGSVLVVQVHREASYADLQKDILHQMMTGLHDNIVTQRLGVLFRLRVNDGLPAHTYLEYDVEHPLYTNAVERALTCCVPGSGPEHLKITAEWDDQTKASILLSIEEVVEEHTSVRQVQLAHEQPLLGTLDECFQLYTQDERLNGDDAWHCPNCRCLQQGTVKSISLWSLPDILIIHLKRFKQDGAKRNKLNTLITFPVTALDMSHHLTESNNTNHHSNKVPPLSSPWRRSKQNSPHPDDNLFDLYGVCNHYGNMQGGHYTAFCRNTADGKWYTFDDTKVTEMHEEEIVTRAAYLLFYQRRNTRQRSVTDPSHWVHLLPRIQMKGSKFKPSKSHEDLLEDAGPQQNVEFSRSIQAYATLRTTVPRVSKAGGTKQQSPVRTPTTPVQTRGITVGQLSRQRDQRQTSSSGQTDIQTHRQPQYSSMASINGASPKPGTPSSIRSTNSDYDNLVPQFERPTTGDSTRLYQTLPHRTHGALIRQSSSPGDVLNGPAALSVTPVKSPSYDFNFGTKKPSPVRVTPLSRGSRSPRSDAGSGQSSYRTAASPSTTHAHVPSDQKRVGLTRSLTSPEVLSTPAQGETTAKRGNKKYPKHEQAKMIFLQESCV